MPDVGQGRRGEDRDDHSKTKARIAVIAYTGLPHALVKKLTPASVDFRSKSVAVPARKKGKGAEARVLPLTVKGLAAFKQFAELECWELQQFKYDQELPTGLQGGPCGSGSTGV